MKYPPSTEQEHDYEHEYEHEHEHESSLITLITNSYYYISSLLSGAADVTNTFLHGPLSLPNK